MAANDKEIWKPVIHIKGQSVKKYLVSSHGQLASYSKSIEDKQILKVHENSGFPMITAQVNGKSTGIFLHHAMAHSFLKKQSSKHNAIIHLDHDKLNNTLENLKWVTPQERLEHNKKNPVVISATAHKIYKGATARKLDEKKVIQLKKEIWNPKRKLSFKQIATKYGIAEMNLYRIKNGILWFHVHVEGEPIFPKYKAQLKNIEFHAKLAAKAKIITDKKKAIYNEKLKAKALLAKKREVEKKKRLVIAEKRKALKALQRIATDKRNAERIIKKKKEAELKEKRAIALAKLKLVRAAAAKKANELKEKRAIALAKAKIAKENAAKKALALKQKQAIAKQKASVKAKK
jgi:hypothetical protein